MLILVFLIGISLISAQECNINGICINSNLLDRTNATSGRECLQDCKEFQGCEWYSFKQGTTTSCELLSNCNELSTENCTICESGQVNCDLIQGFTKILVTANQYSTKSFIVDVRNGSTCESFPDYPDDNNVYGPAWGLLKQKYPFVCDGNDNEDINDCYIFKNGKWKKNVTLPETRKWSGSTVLNKTTLWIAGNSEHENGNNMNTSILVNPFEGTVEPGPELPYNVRTQCMINIDEDQVMFVGGYDGTLSLDETRIYSFLQDSWEMGPTLTSRRGVPACALLTLGSKKVIFVVEDYTSEYLELNGDNIWKEGPGLPMLIGIGRILAFDQGRSAFLFGNGRYGNNPTPFFILKCETDDASQCQWIQMDQTLPFETREPVAMMIPDNIASNCHLKTKQKTE